MLGRSLYKASSFGARKYPEKKGIRGIIIDNMTKDKVVWHYYDKVSEAKAVLL